MQTKTIFAGFGGQGVLLMGYALAYAGMKEDKNVTYLPSYGAEVRGGTANCTVSISDDAEIASPIASEPEYVVVMNVPSLMTFQNRIQTGGLIFLNSSMIHIEPARGDIEVFEIPAIDLAKDSGSVKAANMVMLGAFVKKTGLVSLESLEEAVQDIFPKAKKKAIQSSQKALRKGYDYL